MKLSIIIPVYNEKNTIKTLLDKIRMTSLDLDGVEKEIIVVDDKSTDGTTEMLKKTNKSDIKVIFHNKNLGQGAAILTGIREATGDVIITQDADLEYGVKDYPALIKPIIDGKSDMVYGSRLFRKNKVLYWRYYLGNKLLSWIANLLYNAKITDWLTGFRTFKRDVFKNINVESKRFDFWLEVTARLCNRGYKAYEVPISYRPRTIKQGKKIRVKDGLLGIITLIRYRIFD